MMRIITLLFAIMVTLIFSSMARAKDAPYEKKRAILVMDVREIDLGEVRSDNPVKSVKFCFTNMGEQDLFITETSTGCACTTAKHSKKPVKPGKKGEIQVTYDGTAQPAGSFRKAIMVYSNDARNYTRIFIKGVRVR